MGEPTDQELIERYGESDTPMKLHLSRGLRRAIKKNGGEVPGSLVEEIMARKDLSLGAKKLYLLMVTEAAKNPNAS